MNQTSMMAAQCLSHSGRERSASRSLLAVGATTPREDDRDRTRHRAGASLLAAREARKARAFADDGFDAGRYAHSLRHVRSYQPAPGEREGVNVTSNITAVGGLTIALLAALPVATRAMNAEKSSGGRSRVRTSGRKPHRIHEDAAQAHGLSSRPRAARRGRRVWNRRHERSDDTDSPVPPPRWYSRRRVARRAPSRRIDVVVMSGHPTRSSRVPIRRAVEVCRPRRPPERRRY